MRLSKIAGFSTSMIYVGTLLLSILSFSTTYLGMRILLDERLALIGSFGLQIALLGIAWNLMRIKDNKAYYIITFLTAASFSIIFSYANFDTSLKATTRSNESRAGYAREARTTMNEYRETARLGLQKGIYRQDRLNDLIDLEQKQGWATLIDEGANDQFLQSVLDGARVTVQSWEKRTGKSYRQGKGKGVITNYLATQKARIDKGISTVETYLVQLDSLSNSLNSGLSVKEQHDLANLAWVAFPYGAMTLLDGDKIELPAPPLMANFVEKPETSQQAFLLVINDLFEMDRLALFSLLLAIAVDLIIILMALGGSQIVSNEELIFDRLRQAHSRKIRKLNLDNDNSLKSILSENIERFKTACEYNLEIMGIRRNYKNARNKFFIKLHKGPEGYQDIKSEFEKYNRINKEINLERLLNADRENTEQRVDSADSEKTGVEA